MKKLISKLEEILKKTLVKYHHSQIRRVQVTLALYLHFNWCAFEENTTLNAVRVMYYYPCKANSCHVIDCLSRSYQQLPVVSLKPSLELC